jgi:hypothetical protein
MEVPSRSTHDRASILLGWALGVVCFVYLMTFPPTLNVADESFILYGAKRVLQGQALYRDFFEFLTPGSFYLYALAYWIGGTSITSARATTALFNAISAACTYFLALHVASMAEAVLAGLLVVVICIPVWNMSSHHWLATAFTLVTATILLADRWKDSTRGRPAAAGASAALLICTHQTRGFWLLLWLMVTVPGLVLARAEGARWRRCLRELEWTAIGGAAVCFPVLGYAVWRASLHEMLFATHTWVVTQYREHAAGTIRWSGWGAFWAGGVPYTYVWLFEAIPKILAVEAVAVLWAVWRYGLRSEIVRMALLLLALSSVGGIMYYQDIVHVAFIAPFSLIVLAGLVYRTRTAFLSFHRRWAVLGLRLAWAALLVVVLGKAWNNWQMSWNKDLVFFETAFGTIAGGNVSSQTIHDLRAYLKSDPASPPKLFAYPTDAWIYLTLPADNPTPFALLRPGYNTPEQFQTAMHKIEQDPRAVVVLNSLFAPKNDPLMALLKEHYHDVGGLGPGVIMGEPLYRLYARDATASALANPGAPQ